MRKAKKLEKRMHEIGEELRVTENGEHSRRKMEEIKAEWGLDYGKGEGKKSE